MEFDKDWTKEDAQKMFNFLKWLDNYHVDETTPEFQAAYVGRKMSHFIRSAIEVFGASED